ncbi:ABC transporter permease [Ferroplasma sp.]|uniref:ABC transporter permease n=1 Tax=Ferroplasma sp. TaxID=2591003 RepID=UPI00307D3EDD
MKSPAFMRLTIRNIIVNVDLGTLVFMLGLPTLYLFVMGFMFQGIVTSGVYISPDRSVSYTTFLAPGIIALESFTAGNIGGGMLWSDRRWGMFERLMVGPFRRIDYLLSIISVSIIFSLFGSLIMIVFALTIPIKFNVSVISILMSVFAIVIGTMLFSSLFLIISGISKSMQAYNTITIVLFFMLDFASTAFYPITNNTPEWLRILSGANPLSFIADILRDSLVLSITYNTLLYALILFIVMIAFLLASTKVYKSIRSGI